MEPPRMTEAERRRCSERASEAMNEHRQLGGIHEVASVAAAEAGRRDLWERVRPCIEAAQRSVEWADEYPVQRIYNERMAREIARKREAIDRDIRSALANLYDTPEPTP